MILSTSAMISILVVMIYEPVCQPMKRILPGAGTTRKGHIPGVARPGRSLLNETAEAGPMGIQRAGACRERGAARALARRRRHDGQVEPGDLRTPATPVRLDARHDGSDGHRRWRYHDVSLRLDRGRQSASAPRPHTGHRHAVRSGSSVD